jgi:hypothetical protein
MLQCNGATCSVMAYRRTTRDAQSSLPAVPAGTSLRLRGVRGLDETVRPPRPPSST